MPYPETLIRAIADRHGLVGEVHLLPKGGMVNEAWGIGDQYVLRIVMPHLEAACDTECRIEAEVVPWLTEAGIATPSLVAVDPTSDFAPRPYTVYERAAGDVLGFCVQPYRDFTQAIFQLGQEIAKVHQVAALPGSYVATLNGREVNVAKWLSRTIEKDAISESEAGEIQDFADHLLALGGLPADCLVHNDTHPWNIMVVPETGQLSAIIDWGDAKISDPASDLASMPIACLPPLINGYIGTRTTDFWRLDEASLSPYMKALIARSLVWGLNVALFEIRSPELLEFERSWWRMPEGDWPEMRHQITEMFPWLFTS